MLSAYPGTLYIPRYCCMLVAVVSGVPVLFCSGVSALLPAGAYAVL